MKRRHRITEHLERGCVVYTVAPKDCVECPRVLFLHGGAYYNGFLPFHWDFINYLVANVGCSVTAPDFPLAPEAGVDDIFEMIEPIYRSLVTHSGSARLTVIGDSSGGGLSLALAQKARDRGLPQPKDLVLLSPWLDVTMTNPGIVESNRKDPYLGLHACISAGQRYAQGDDPQQPDISPIYGSIEGLGPISLFVGTHDIMLPDCRKLQAMAEAQGIPYSHVEFADMIHDWMLLTLPESIEARNQICEIIRRIA